MRNFFKSGGAFILLSILFMVIAVIAEKPAPYVSLGALWLVLGLAMAAKNKKPPSSDQHKDTP